MTACWCPNCGSAEVEPTETEAGPEQRSTACGETIRP
jgi:hypothetical protein